MIGFTLDQNNRWQVPDWFDELRAKAKDQGLWNLFLPHEYRPGPGSSAVSPLALLAGVLSHGAGWEGRVQEALAARVEGARSPLFASQWLQWFCVKLRLVYPSFLFQVQGTR